MSEQKNKLSLEPYKGTRDFYPQDQFIQNYIFSVWKKVVQSYGYLEYNASILEETELYKAKSGEEIVNDQTYSFTDRGGREVTIRPEMTPTVARLVAQKRKELSFPLRWFSIPNLFRYERPQRGRLREHWQLNVDMFGVDSIEADVEIISIAYDIMKAFGAKDEDFIIKVNSRGTISRLLREYFLFTEEQSYKVIKLIDRKSKLSHYEFINSLTQIITEEEAKKLQELLSENDIREMPEEVILTEDGYKLSQVIDTLKSRGISNIQYDPTLMRGFDYYTGIVFEVFDTSPENNRSVFGGGRYDDLVGMFGVEKVSGIGFGKGDVVIRDFLETHGLLPEYKSVVDIYICPFDTSFTEPANTLASQLRKQGLNVAVDLTDRKVSSKVKTADREQIPWVVVIGDQEVKSDNYKLKNLKEGKEYEVVSNEITSLIKK